MLQPFPQFLSSLRSIGLLGYCWRYIDINAPTFVPVWEMGGDGNSFQTRVNDCDSSGRRAMEALIPHAVAPDVCSAFDYHDRPRAVSPKVALMVRLQ